MRHFVFQFIEWKQYYSRVSVTWPQCDRQVVGLTKMSDNVKPCRASESFWINSRVFPVLIHEIGRAAGANFVNASLCVCVYLIDATSNFSKSSQHKFVNIKVTHFLQVGLLLSPITYKCLLKVLCSVRRPVTTLETKSVNAVDNFINIKKLSYNSFSTLLIFWCLQKDLTLQITWQR
jgi:hypothetical protein